MKWVNVIGLVVLLNYVLCKLYICCLMSFFGLMLFSYQNLFKKIMSLGACWIQGKIGVLFKMSFRYAHLSAYRSKPYQF